MRRLRQAGRRPPRAASGAPADERLALVRRHARTGLTFLTVIAVGYSAGPVILGLVRDKPVFGSAHALFATLTLVVVLSGGFLGYRLWRGHGSPRDRELHAYCMGLGLFLLLIAAAFGLGLLP
jgi:hypothetical protein